MQQLEIECRITLLASIKNGDAVAALKVLERLDRRLAPPRLSHGIEHSGDLTRLVPDMSDAELLERATNIVNRVGPLVNGAKANGEGQYESGQSYADCPAPYSTTRLLLAPTGPLSDVDNGLIPECAHVRSSRPPQ